MRLQESGGKKKAEEEKGDGAKDFWQLLGEGTRWPSCMQSWLGGGWGVQS